VILLLLLCSKITDNPAVRGLFVGGDLRFLYEEARICAFQFLYPLEQASYFVFEACFPHSFCCGILDKMTVIQNIACVFVNDGTNEVVCGKLALRQLVYCECITDCQGCACCGHDRLWHECVGYCAVNHVRRALPELAPGGRPGVGWSHILAVGRVSHNNG
jgi:hypothetical protein